MHTWGQRTNSGIYGRSLGASTGRKLLGLILPMGILAGLCFAGEWPQYRGPNGSGVGTATRLPAEFGPEKNVVWKTPVPFGHSSPVIGGDLIFITGGESTHSPVNSDHIAYQGKLYTLAIDRRTGKVVWRREAPRNRVTGYQVNNSPATPSAVTDGNNVYVFFGDFGLLAYSKNGAERWRLPLGPLNNQNGVGSSPILYGDLLVLTCDQDNNDSYLLAVDKNTGRVRWKTPRPEVTRSYVTPAVFQPKDGPAELIVPGPLQVTAYYAATGEKVWWARGLWWQSKSVPVFDGDAIYAIAADAQGEEESNKKKELPTFTELLAKYDANHDGKLSVGEFSGDSAMQKIAPAIDRDGKGFVDEHDWNTYCTTMAARNNLLAIRHGGHGDLTDTNVIWSMQKSLPTCTSPLIYQGVMYLVKNGGILTALDPKTGKILKQGRLRGALDDYYASPVAAAGKVFLVSQTGKATVVKAGADWEILKVNDLDDDSYATPAIADDTLYVRTRGTLYCFADQE
jgi:outer membrane protein assembly factor BamB